jgi:predicted anti-sigma-YlaC factor YlaD
VSADSRLHRERCSRPRQRISLQVDGELSARGRLLLALHLTRCAPCRTFRAELAAMVGALRSTALAAPASASRLRVVLQPPRLALAGGLAVLGLTLTMSGVLSGTGVGEIGALSPVQGLPVYSTPYQLEGLPVYTRPPGVHSTLAS